MRSPHDFLIVVIHVDLGAIVSSSICALCSGESIAVARSRFSTGIVYTRSAGVVGQIHAQRFARPRPDANIWKSIRDIRLGHVVAHDSVAHLRELMEKSSLEGVFAQLTQPEDTNAVARRILDVVST